MEKEWAKRVFAVVAGIVHCDDTISSNERRLLDGVQQRFKLTDEERAAIEPVTSPAEVTEALTDLPREHRGPVLELVLNATMADGVVADTERELVDAVNATLQDKG